MKKIYIVSAALLILIPLTASAALIEKGPSYTLLKDQTINTNIYAAGNNITMLGTANEDLMAAGGTIIIAGRVVKDASLAGGTIDIPGEVGEDARLAGGTMVLNGKVGGELVALGGQITVAPGAEVKKDSYIIGGNITVDGHIDQYLVIKGGTVEINGVIDGSVKVTASKKLTIGSNAVIGGALDYSAPQKAEIADGAKIGGVTSYKQYILPKNTVGVNGIFAFWFLAKFLMLLLAAVVVSLLFKKQMQTLVRHALPNFGKELLRGFIILVVLPVAIIISFVSIVGGILGAAALLLYIAIAMFGTILSPIILGAIPSKYIFKQANFEGNWKSAIIGAIVLSVISAIPIAGGVVCFVFFLVGFGTIFNFIYKYFRNAEK
jgi:hypothetical protein